MNVGSTYLSNGKTHFTVWAPLKERMVLHITHPSEQKLEMQKDVEGYFHADAAVLPGTRYFFMPDGTKDFPDPASRFQPMGVHGPSEVVDHFFEWHDANWNGRPFDELILYELH